MGAATVDQKKIALFHIVRNSVDKVKRRARGVINELDICVSVVGTALPGVYPMNSIVHVEIKPIFFFVKYRV